MTVNKKQKVVLLVEDTDHIREMVQAILEIEGYKVVATENGRKALEILDRPGFEKIVNFMVLDVRMPELDGLGVLDSIRTQEKYAELPVLMLTAEDKPDDIMIGYEKGATYYVTKPFTREQLIYGIKMVLG
jgi:DNA-binding response OmpR family regulator